MDHNILEKLKSGGFYLTNGHFRLVSGKHSDAYVQVRLSLMDPTICTSFTDTSLDLLSNTHAKPTALAAFTIGGLLLAESLSTHIGVPLVIGRKRSSTIEWIDGDKLEPNTRLLVVDDVLTTSSQLNIAILSLEKTLLGEISGFLIAVNRSQETPELKFRGTSVPIHSCVKIPLVIYDPSDCPICKLGIPPTDLSNPEQNFVSVLLSQPSKMSDYILEGYEKIYRLQKEEQLIKEIAAWKPWLPVLIAGLPIARMEEDSRVIRFVSHLTQISLKHEIETRVLSELVGQLLRLALIKIESRSIGCSIVIGDTAGIHRFLESKARVRLPIGITFEKISELIPYFDAYNETHFVLVIGTNGNVVDLRRLIYNRPYNYKEGVELLRFVTSRTSSLAFVMRRGRCAISVYGKGRLEAIGELSERSGLWEFSRPMERIDEISKLVPEVSEVLLVTIVEVSRELVYGGHGGLFILGSFNGLKHTPPKVDIKPQLLEEMSIEDLVGLAKLDGAMMINEKGELTKATVIIQNQGKDDGRTRQLASRHGGSRKETARRTSIENKKCVAVYVSQNGAIEVYVDGDSYSIAEAIPGMARE